MGLGNDGKLVAARWGRKVVKKDFGATGTPGVLALTETTDVRERAAVQLSVYRIVGDRLEGRELDGDTKAVTARSFNRAR